ncbi:MAG: MFS transporter [Candidatus Bathyarchaeota archaeon]|nr:MAG: MFS transporter [Candidatus Bathyarchaeota archaeon]
MSRDPIQRGAQFVRRQKRPFKVNMAKQMVSNFSFGLTQQYQSLYISELGADPLQLGYVTSLGGVASTLITAPIGWLADRYGIKRMILASLLVSVLGYSIFGLATSWQMTALALIATTFAYQIGFTVCPMICGRTLASRERATGMQLCDTLSALPRLAAPIVAAYLITILGGISVEGIRPLYWIEVTGLVIASLIFFRYFTDPPGGENSRHLRFSEGIRRVLREGVAIKRWIALSMLSVLPMYMSIYVPIYAREVKGASPYTIGLMDAAFYLVIVLLAIHIGLSADRHGKKRLITLMTPLYAASLLLLVLAPNELTLIAAGFLNGFLWLTLVVQGSIFVELVPRELLGSWSGMTMLFRGFVNIASPTLGGLLWDSLGPEYVFYFLIAVWLLRLLIIATIPATNQGGNAETLE